MASISLFSVLTIKHLGISENTFESKLFEYLENQRNTLKYYVVKEYGKNGDNPHYNILEDLKKAQRTDNRNTAWSNWYKRNSWEVAKGKTIQVKIIKDEIDLIMGYLKKEEKAYIFPQGNYITEERKKLCLDWKPQTDKQLQFPKYQVFNFMDMCHLILAEHDESTWSRDAFKKCIKRLLASGINIQTVLNKPSQYFIVVGQLISINDEQLDRYLENKLSRDLNIF